MFDAVSCGLLSDDLAKRSPGSLTHARWLTTAHRILRLYVSINELSQNLTTPVEFVILAYIPVWFETKTIHTCKPDARHLCKKA